MTSSTSPHNLNNTQINTNTGIFASASPPVSNNSNEVAVKVAVRVRPLNNREKLHQHQPCVRIASETNQIVIGKDKVFSFDFVIPPKTSQAELYETCVKSLVQSLFEGYNATVFAYGQTGSGKTHTISGNKNSVEEFGIIPRAVHTMFQIINSNNTYNKEYCVKVNFIEIYKEELKDLLDTTEKDIQIREDEAGNTLIYGANEIICNSLEDVMACFDSGNMLRHTGSTLMNEQSSRSHSVFTICIEQRWNAENANKTLRDSSTLYDLNKSAGEHSFYLGAKFHFVDLAGSERVNRTGNVGDRFKESVHINSGLLALGNVISALSSNESNTKKKITHIPYRESKITRILKDSLGGNANTLMICCISPSSCNLDESINAVKYASRARYIKNKPIVNLDPQAQKFVEMQSEIQALREELIRQRTALMSAKFQSENMNNQIQNEELEARLQNTELELDCHKKLVKEAYTRFKQLSKADLNSANKSANVRKLVDEWLNMFEASKQNKAEFDVEDHSRQKIALLEQQLKEAQDYLKSDEEIFNDKEKEINSLKGLISDLEDKLSTANNYLEASYQKEKEQKELMLQLQMQLDKLMQNKFEANDQNNGTKPMQSNSSKQSQQQNQHSQLNKAMSTLGISNIVNNSTSIKSTSIGNKNRAKTAPNNENTNQQTEKKNRTTYSSPAVFTLERIMQSFRARSQLLAETLEENDTVLQNKFNSTFDVERDDLDGEKINEEDLIDDSVDDESTENDGKFVRKGTFKVHKPKSKQSIIPTEEGDDDQKKNISRKTNYSAASNKKNSTESVPSSPALVNNIQEANKKLRDLNINIRMKEELIKELVANSKFTNRINMQYQHKIESLEKEANQYKAEINELHQQISEISTTGTLGTAPLGLNKEQSRVEIELKKKLEQAQIKITDLEVKSNQNAKALNATTNTDKRVSELELALTKMRQQNEVLQKKIKEDSEKRFKLEKDFEKEQQKLKDLEMRTEQQQKVLKKKTEDLVTAQRRLRSGSSSGHLSPDDNNINNVNKHWIEQEMEKVLQEKRQMELLKEELHTREELIKKKELLLDERNELMSKKLQSSQLNKESLAIIDKKLNNINKSMTSNDNSTKETSMKELEETHSNLIKQRKIIEKRLNQGDVLSANEERRLIEIEEAIEALEIAIDYENESITVQKNKLRDSILLNNEKGDIKEISEHVLKKLSSVPYEETQNLVKKFFQKIIILKESEHKNNVENSELKMQLEEQNRIVDQLKQSLNASKSEFEKRLLEQKSKLEHNNRFLSTQLNDCNSKIEVLEKEISIYKEKLNIIRSGATKHEHGSINDLSKESGFYLKHSKTSSPVDESSNHLSGSKSIFKDLNGKTKSVSSTHLDTSMSTSSAKVVKVSRKDLRVLTEEELLKRSLKKDNFPTSSGNHYPTIENENKF